MIQRLFASIFHFLISPPKILRNRYVFTLVVAAIWISVFDKNSMVKRHHLNHALTAELAENDYLKSEIVRQSAQKDALETSKETLEKFAREEYYMKRENEEIILFVPYQKPEEDQ